MTNKYLHDIREVRGKDVTLLLIDNDGIADDWICAYARLPGFKDDNYSTPQTYHTGDVVGVDTAHAWNDGMDIEEREVDAIEQIERVIKYWEKQQIAKRLSQE